MSCGQKWFADNPEREVEYDKKTTTLATDSPAAKRGGAGVAEYYRAALLWKDEAARQEKVAKEKELACARKDALLTFLIGEMDWTGREAYLAKLLEEEGSR